MDPHIDLKRMRYIVEAARAETITAAADGLGITQSALSRSIADIEDAVGVQLFSRIPRGIQLTEAGERFVVGAMRLLGDVDDFIAEVKTAPEVIGGRLRIGVAPAGYIDELRDPLLEFIKQYPNVNIEISTGTSDELCNQLIGGAIELLYSYESILSRWDNISRCPIVPLYWGIIVRPGHPLLALDRDITAADIIAYPYVFSASAKSNYSKLPRQVRPSEPKYVLEDFLTIQAILKNTDSIYYAAELKPAPAPQWEGFVFIRAFGPGRIKQDQVLAVGSYASRATTVAAERFDGMVKSFYTRWRAENAI